MFPQACERKIEEKAKAIIDICYNAKRAI